ncbi:MAG: hypothetical protein IJT34_05925 [Butyrivibrio sp.]|nr:hypothetical protein [Butyrivibrio sp.]
MRIIEQRASIEVCTEAGWEAYDLLTEQPLSDEDIEALRHLGGSFLYLRQLRKPFFKLEAHNFILKGVRGDCFFRMAVHREHLAELDRVRNTFM